MKHQAVLTVTVCGAFVALVMQRAVAQTVSPIAPKAQSGHSTDKNPKTPGPFGSSSLPPTGHATRFKKYAGGDFGQRTTTARPSISPYLNLLRPGDPGLNYHLGVRRDQEIYNIGSQARESQTQLGGLRRDIQAKSQQPIALRPSATEQGTPLKKRVVEQESRPAATTDGGETLVLREILKELKTIREHVAPVEEKKQD